MKLLSLLGIPRYLYRGTSTQHAGDSFVTMHVHTMNVDRSPSSGLPERIFFTDDPGTALIYARDFAKPAWMFFESAPPAVLRVDTTKEPEFRRLLRGGASGEWYIPTGVFRFRHPPLVIAIGKTGWKEIRGFSSIY